jgi:lipopolysaccharide/colanic/teichoic acid biosynthesis glycosyltransferase
MTRRAVDIVVSSLALVISAPVLVVAIVAIRLESRGGAIYRQRRAGLHGRQFDVLKLRTMVAGAESIGAGLAVNENDPRITRVGALLRRTSLDELPNLVNVLRGEMSLIGRGRRCRCRSSSTPSASAGVWRSGRASPAGRRSTAAPRCLGRSGSSSTCTTSRIARRRST